MSSWSRGVPTATGRALQVVDVSTSKTGKHGHAKCHFVAIDIFTTKKMEELVPSSHNLEVHSVIDIVSTRVCAARARH